MITGSRPSTKICIACGVEEDVVSSYQSLTGIPLCNDCFKEVGRAYRSLFLDGKYDDEDDWPSRPYRKLPIPDDLRWQVFLRDNFTCRHCGSRLFLQADHITAESAGGPATMDNLQTLCRSCNSRKGTR